MTSEPIAPTLHPKRRPSLNTGRGILWTSPTGAFRLGSWRGKALVRAVYEGDLWVMSCALPGGPWVSLGKQGMFSAAVEFAERRLAKSKRMR